MAAQHTSATDETAAPETKQPTVSNPTGDSDPVRFFYDKVSPWVNRGAVYGFEMHEELCEPSIVEHESAICALAVVSTGTVLGVTSGNRGHLFYFHPSFYVADLGVISERPVTGGAIAATHGDVVVAGWHGEKGGLVRHNAAREFGTGQEDFRSRKDPVTPVPLPGPEDGVNAVAYNSAEHKVYGLTTTSLIISLHDDAEEVQVECELSSEPAPALLVLPDGSLLGAGAHGQLWQYRPGGRRAENLGAYGPCEKGKRYVAGVQSLLLSESGLVYGGTSTDGFVFAYDPARRQLVNLGKPHRQSFVRALVEGHDGTIYGVVQEPQGIARLFCYDPEARGFEDLGVLNTFIPIQWAPHSIGAMCVGLHGEIYLGEDDTISHLFVYHPPVVRAGCR